MNYRENARVPTAPRVPAARRTLVVHDHPSEATSPFSFVVGAVFALIGVGLGIRSLAASGSSYTMTVLAVLMLGCPAMVLSDAVKSRRKRVRLTIDGDQLFIESGDGRRSSHALADVREASVSGHNAADGVTTFHTTCIDFVKAAPFLFDERPAWLRSESEQTHSRSEYEANAARINRFLAG